MRHHLALLLLTVAACSDTPPERDAGPTPDAALDAGQSDDAGLLPVPCKSLTCNGHQEYCRLTPVGPCTIMDAGACAAGEEACVTTGGSGCTPERTPSCEPLDGCSNCPCLINVAPCGPSTVEIRCRGAGEQIVLECPFP